MKWSTSTLFGGVLICGILFSVSLKVHAGEVTYDLPILSSYQQWGQIGIDYAAHTRDQKALSLQIGDTTYDKGIGSHANGNIELDLSGQYESFSAVIGVQHHSKSANCPGSVIFKVLVDGEERFKSDILTVASPPQPIRIDVRGAMDMSLIAEDAGDGITCDMADWADASLTKADQIVQIAHEQSLDIMPFARVMSWDGNTNESKPGRCEEFRVEDIYPGNEIRPVDDEYVLQPDAAGQCCIGGQWAENRRIRQYTIEFADGKPMPDPEKTIIERWVGSSSWWGWWKPVSGTVKQEGRFFVYSSSIEDYTTERYLENKVNQVVPGVPKFRWVFHSKTPIHIRKLSAYTRDRWNDIELRLSADQNLSSGIADIEVYNGIIKGGSPDSDPYHCRWLLDKPLELTVSYCINKIPPLSNRTLLKIMMPNGASSVSVADIIKEGCVYVPDHGFFAVTSDSDLTLEQYQQQTDGQKSVLPQVRDLPDQTYAGAFEALQRYNTIPHSPIMLSLACDNNKCVATQKGEITRYHATEYRGNWTTTLKKILSITPTYGSAEYEKIESHLDGGWYPIPVTTVTADGVTYRQETFVSPLTKNALPLWCDSSNQRSICICETTVSNSVPGGSTKKMKIDLEISSPLAEDLNIYIKGHIFRISTENQVLAYLVSSEPGLAWHIKGRHLIASGNIEPNGQQKFVLYIPLYDIENSENPEKQQDMIQDVAIYKAALKTYWNEILNQAIQLSLPDKDFENLLKASQIHCLIAARNEQSAQYITPWVSSEHYGPLDGEGQSVILGMGMMGHQSFAERAMDYFVNCYNPQGYLTRGGYTLVGTGQNLWTMAYLYNVLQNKAWFIANAAKIMPLCEWIIRQRNKTCKLDPEGNKLPEYGLFPPAVAADWPRFAYRAQVQAHFCAGLKDMAEAMKDIDFPGYETLLQESRDFRQEIRRAFQWATSNSPVMKLRNGTWIPYCPTFLYARGSMDDLYPGEDVGRTWAYDAEVGANHLAAAGIFEFDDPEVGYIMNAAEDNLFLHSGMGSTYPAEVNLKDIFNYGGFGKVQSYYGRYAEIYAKKDDVKPFIRSYFNSVCTIIDPEALSLWEHPFGGAYNKTHETGWFLYHTRLMLAQERDGELWLAPLLTHHWQKDGMTVSIQNIPTAFGKTGYVIRSNTSKGCIEADITLPDVSLPKAIVIRLRHPQEMKMTKVLINSAEHDDFDPDKETVKIKPNNSDPVHVQAFYN